MQQGTNDERAEERCASRATDTRGAAAEPRPGVVVSSRIWLPTETDLGRLMAAWTPQHTS